MIDEDSSTLAPTDSLAETWKRLKNGDMEARHEFVVDHLSLVKSIAWDVYRKASLGYVDIRDLIQLGVVGLLEAIPRFDPTTGVSFSGFASKRIRGAILNGIHEQSEHHAQTNFRSRIRRERLASLSKQEKGSTLSSDVFIQMVETALGLAVGYLLENTAMYVDESHGVDRDYSNAGEVAVIAESLRSIVSMLPQPDRRVIELHYLSSMQFSDVAEMMGVTKGRVSQIHARALKTLRELQSSKTNVNFEI